MHCFAEHPKAPQKSAALQRRHSAEGSIPVGGLQAKLAVSTPGNAYEEEADRMAEQVLRMPDTAKGLGSPCRGSCPECHPPAGVLRKSAGAAERGVGGELPPASEAAIHAVAGGQSLSEQQRRYFEPLFGADFSGVRLHTGPSADLAAQSIGALAYTRGRDVVFRRDHYRPETESGQQLLAHELAHTVQQGSAPAKPSSADRSNGNFLSPLRTHSAESSVLRLQRQEELQNRTLQELFVVTESFEAFQLAMEEWLARYVMSSAAREQALVRASNLAALHHQLLIGLEPGQTVRIQATLEAGLDRYERVIFSTPGLTILDPIAITGATLDPIAITGADATTAQALHSRARALPQQRTLSEAGSQQAALLPMVSLSMMSREDFNHLHEDAAAEWTIDRLGAFENQLRESASTHNIPMQLLATIILNELTDINLLDIIQQGRDATSGSLGIAQIQVQTALDYGLIDLPEDTDMLPSVDVLQTRSPRLLVGRRLQVPQFAIEAAARNIARLLRRMGENLNRPFQIRYQFIATGPVGDSIYDSVWHGNRILREGKLAYMVGAAYNSPDIIIADDPVGVDSRYNVNAIPNGQSAEGVAQILARFGLFREMPPAQSD